MSRLADVFGPGPVLLPVVHPATRETALDSIAVATTAGCKGIFLIDQGMTVPEVLQLVLDVRALYPTLWIGVNLLSRRPPAGLAEALDTLGTLDGLWSDNVGVELRRDEQPEANAFVAVRRLRAWTGLYFGGTAFKYQAEVAAEDLAKTAALAAQYLDVICTSGPGTGMAADVAKVRAMRSGTDAPIALASGVTPDNVRDYLPYVDAYLVGTGIEKSFGVLDPARVEALLRAMS